MRITKVLAGIAGVVILVPAISAGCNHPEEDCERSERCPTPTVGATGMGAGGSDAGTDPMCIPSQASGAVDDTCGIFVSKMGNDMNAGTKGSPVATIGHAVLEAKGTRPIYVCADTFDEVVEAQAGVELYGGLDCASGWTWSDAGRTTLSAPPDSVPLKLTSGEKPSRVENFSVMARDATQAGGSSIAVIIDNVPTTLVNCELTAGTAQNGADGQQDMTSATPGANGDQGKEACGADVSGGNGGMITCDGGMSQGGNGGSGGIASTDSGNGQKGTDGQPIGSAGIGGVGQTDPVGACMSGQAGADGSPGALGLGGTELGALSISGISGGNGMNGGAGTPGQGGGGGGGAKAGVFCGGAEGPGASGGGGGSGGCGGKGGPGGQAGGSSIALISLNSQVTMTNVKLTAGNGGKGGAGAAPQPGAQPGNGGPGGAKKVNPSKPGCDGGKGGYGGDGGPGGGGRGGHSLGIAYRGTAPSEVGFTIMVGTPGEGGMGATMEPTGMGASGTVSTTPLTFP